MRLDQAFANALLGFVKVLRTDAEIGASGESVSLDCCLSFRVPLKASSSLLPWWPCCRLQRVPNFASC